MKIVYILALFLAGSFGLQACSGKKAIEGKYILENDSKTYLELKRQADEYGTFSLSQRGVPGMDNGPQSGNYHLFDLIEAERDDFIQLFEYQGGVPTVVATGKIRGNEINFTGYFGSKNGYRFIKTSSSIDSPTGAGARNKANSDQLTTDKVQNALNRWVSSYPGASMQVVGIRELPQENAAMADLSINNFRFTIDTGYITMNKECHSCSGTARLVHYNDGRWVLSVLETSVGGEWKDINIEAK